MNTPDEPLSTTISVKLSHAENARLYTYQCNYPVAIGDLVNVKLPSSQIFTTAVLAVHPTPQLSDKWETKWAVVVKTVAEVAAERDTSSDLGKALGFDFPPTSLDGGIQNG
jgi:hypothetical protein